MPHTVAVVIEAGNAPYGSSRACKFKQAFQPGNFTDCHMARQKLGHPLNGATDSVSADGRQCVQIK